MIRDPSTDPQPGDVLHGDYYIRKVVRRKSDWLLVKGRLEYYWMRLDSGQKWCETSGNRLEVQAALVAAEPKASAKKRGQVN
jgi:hypothetical protein